jgi:hypothetical protein
MDNYRDIIYLNDKNKKLISNYFGNMNGKFKIEDNLLYIEFDNWGKEIFFISEEANTNFYIIHFDNIITKYNLAISIQIGNWHIFTMMEDYIRNFKNININYYFVLIRENATEENINYLKEKYYNNCAILSGENRGMDIGLFFISLHYIKYKQYNHDYLFKIHTKTNDAFRNETLNNLMGSENKIIENIKSLSKDKIGMISGNIIYSYNRSRDVFQSNLYHLENLVKYLYQENIDFNNLDFSGGTMFISKFKIYNILNLQKIEYLYNSLNNNQTLDYYWYSIFYKISINNKEKINKDYNLNKLNRHPNNISFNQKTGKSGLRDSMIEHAMERLLGYICKKNNLEIIR